MTDRSSTPEELSQARQQDSERELQQNARARAEGGFVMLSIPLPFQFPLYEGFRYRWSERDARQLELVHYREENYEPRVGEPIFEEEAEAVPTPDDLQPSYTVCRIGMPVPLKEISRFNTFMTHPDIAEATSRYPQAAGVPAPEPNETLGQLLEEGLLALNFLIRVHRIVTHDPFLYPIEGLTKLPILLLCTLWDIREVQNLAFGEGCLSRQDLRKLGNGLFQIHFQIPIDREMVAGREETSKIVGLASSALRGDPHPFLTSTDLMRNAGLRINGGDYNAGIIESVTAIETFTSTFLRLHLKDQGDEEKRINNILEAGLKNVLKEHVAPKLGFAFNPHNPGNPVDHWYASAYRLRNDVVHRGLFANNEQARRSLQESQKVITYMRQQMEKEPSKFQHMLDLITPETKTKNDI